MKAIITGMKGTVAPRVYGELSKNNIDVISWDRTKVSIEDEEIIYNFIKNSEADMFFHLATGPVKWLELIAKCTAKLGVKLIFTSTVSVFSEKGTGPYNTESIPNSEEDYGRYKIECENTVGSYNKEAVILRLGWQIGSEAGSNNMFDFLEASQSEKGLIEASSKWYPSCSFLEETARVIVEAGLNYKADTYLVNSNKKHSFYEIVNFLKEKHHKEWKVKEITHFQRDDRMFDDRVGIKEMIF